VGEENTFVSAHRGKILTVKKNFKGLMESLNLIASTYDYPIIVARIRRCSKQIV
jgi:UDP-N-acetylglucosamine 2-epimerase (non-hydrolysing)